MSKDNWLNLENGDLASEGDLLVVDEGPNQTIYRIKDRTCQYWRECKKLWHGFIAHPSTQFKRHATPEEIAKTTIPLSDLPQRFPRIWLSKVKELRGEYSSPASTSGEHQTSPLSLFDWAHDFRTDDWVFGTANTGGSIRYNPRSENYAGTAVVEGARYTSWFLTFEESRQYVEREYLSILCTAKGLKLA